MVMEEGVAHLCFVSPNTTFMKHKVEKAIPRKSHYNNNNDKHL
jgi:hypothetical protein